VRYFHLPVNTYHSKNFPSIFMSPYILTVHVSYSLLYIRAFTFSASLLTSLNFGIPMQNQPFRFSRSCYNNVHVYISLSHSFSLSQYVSKDLFFFFFFFFFFYTGESGGKVSILGGDSIGHFEKKKFHMNMCRIRNGYVDRTV
jgi:hypothetical protein